MTFPINMESHKNHVPNHQPEVKFYGGPSVQIWFHSEWLSFLRTCFEHKELTWVDLLELLHLKISKANVAVCRVWVVALRKLPFVFPSETIFHQAQARPVIFPVDHQFKWKIITLPVYQWPWLRNRNKLEVPTIYFWPMFQVFISGNIPTYISGPEKWYRFSPF